MDIWLEAFSVRQFQRWQEKAIPMLHHSRDEKASDGCRVWSCIRAVSFFTITIVMALHSFSTGRLGGVQCPYHIKPTRALDSVIYFTCLK